MSTPQELAGADLAPLAEHGAMFARAADGLEPAAEQLHSARPAGWVAAAAELAAQSGWDQADRLAGHASRARSAADRIADGHAELTDLQQQLRTVIDRLEPDGYLLTASGVVKLAPQIAALAMKTGIDVAATAEQELADRAEQVHTAARAFEQADHRLAADLAVLLDDPATATPDPSRFTAAPVAPESIPEPGTAPATVRDWWDRLDPGQREQLLVTSPATIGALDGLPTEVRSQANAAQLRTLLAGLGPGTAREDAIALQQTLATRPQTSLLGVTQRGNRLTATVGIGDVDRADTVLTYTPGTTTTIRTSLDQMIDEVEALTDEAARISDRSADHDRSYAAVIAMDYDIPPKLADAIFTEPAQDGAPDLARLWRGLDVTAESADRRLVAAGHSYGTYVAALAMLDDPGHPVDAALFLGSPGIPAASATALGLPEGSAFHLTTDDDPISIGHDFKTGSKGVSVATLEAGMAYLGLEFEAPGWTPNQIPILAPFPMVATGVGLIADQILPYDHPDATEIDQLAHAAGPGPDGQMLIGASGHSEYIRPGPDGMRMTAANIAAVLAGRDDWAVRAGD